MLNRHLPCTGLLRDLQGSTRKGLERPHPSLYSWALLTVLCMTSLPVVLTVGTSNEEGLWGRLLFIRAGIKVLGW